jgi:hypothetical protein
MVETGRCQAMCSAGFNLYCPTWSPNATTPMSDPRLEERGQNLGPVLPPWLNPGCVRLDVSVTRRWTMPCGGHGRRSLVPCKGAAA